MTNAVDQPASVDHPASDAAVAAEPPAPAPDVVDFPALLPQAPARKRDLKRAARKALSIAEKVCMILLAIVILLFALATLVDEADVRRSPTQSSSMR